jgi:hypothetical protein
VEKFCSGGQLKVLNVGKYYIDGQLKELVWGIIELMVS